jgi:hypothetical protein
MIKELVPTDMDCKVFKDSIWVYEKVFFFPKANSQTRIYILSKGRYIITVEILLLIIIISH